MADMIDVQVLIIGAGPSGATLALLLAQQGITVRAISRHKSTANTPRAHIFNQRAMEVLRDAGIEQSALSVASPAGCMQNTTWSHTLAGEEYGRMWAWGNKPSERHIYDTASPCGMTDLPQSYLEPILIDAARHQGAEVIFNTELLAFQDHGDVVMAHVRERADGREETVRCQYLIGADGARSPRSRSVKNSDHWQAAQHGVQRAHQGRFDTVPRASPSKSELDTQP